MWDLIKWQSQDVKWWKLIWKGKIAVCIFQCYTSGIFFFFLFLISRKELIYNSDFFQSEIYTLIITHCHFSAFLMGHDFFFFSHPLFQNIRSHLLITWKYTLFIYKRSFLWNRWENQPCLVFDFVFNEVMS